MSVFKRTKIRLQTIDAKDVALMGVFGALMAVVTMIAVPLPVGGYFHFGNTIVYVTSIFFGGFVGGVAGAIGGMISDIALGFGLWAPFTLVCKFINGQVCGHISNGKSLLRDIIATLGGILSNVVTYGFVYWYLLGWPAMVGWYVMILPLFWIDLLATLLIVTIVRGVYPRILTYRESVAERIQTRLKAEVGKYNP